MSTTTVGKYCWCVRWREGDMVMRAVFWAGSRPRAQFLADEFSQTHKNFDSLESYYVGHTSDVS